MFKLLKYLNKKDYVLLTLVVLFVFAQVYFELKVPETFSEIINMITEQASSSVNYQPIIYASLIMLGYAFGTFLVYLIVNFLMAQFSSSFSRSLRSAFYNKVLFLSMNEVKNFSVASLITRTTNDISQVQKFFSMGLKVIITAPIMAIMAILKIFNGSLSLTLGTVIAVVSLVVLITGIFLIVIPKFSKIQTLTDKLNLMSRENLTGTKVIRAYNKEKYHEQRFDKINNDLTKTNVFVDRIMSLLDPIIVFVLSTLVLFIYWYGSILASQNQLLIGDIIAFAQYALMVLFSLTMLTFVFIMMPRASVSAKRLNEVFKSKTSVVFDQNNLITLNDDEKPLIEFKNVSFKYPTAKENVIKNISLKINRGETVAFIGSTGSGKSTLVNLLVRFYDCTDGEVLIDGNNIKDFDKESLLEKIGYVPQKGLLFSGTIKSNMTFGNKNATEEQIVHACEIAQASFVNKYEDKFEHEVVQSGSNFSGGQRQRLSIARVIVKNPELFIFDDSFSALDYKTDKRLRKSLYKEFPNKTKLIVAQRVGTIIDADKIVVLENGEMVGIGTHEELLKNCEVYREIAESQLGQGGVLRWVN